MVPASTLQRYKKAKVDYDSGFAKPAREHRANTNRAAEVNVGRMVVYSRKEGYEGLIDNTRESAGPDLHAEKLLIGSALLQVGEFNGFGSWNTGAFKELARGNAILYTEREPCPGCYGILDKEFGGDDHVKYTVPYAKSEKMTSDLKDHIDTHVLTE